MKVASSDDFSLQPDEWPSLHEQFPSTVPYSGRPQRDPFRIDLTKPISGSMAYGKPVTYVSMLLDETGSMHTILSDTIGGFNTWIDGLREGTEINRLEMRVSVVKFDSKGFRPLAVLQTPDNTRNG